MATSKRFNKLLPKVRECFAQHPVERAWLFGSFSRGEENPESDVDFLVQYDKDAKITLFTISRLSLALQDVLDRPVDVVEDGRLLPFVLPSAEHDKILVYERAH